jgi:hypothetical protein
MQLIMLHYFFVEGIHYIVYISKNMSICCMIKINGYKKRAN